MYVPPDRQHEISIARRHCLLQEIGDDENGGEQAEAFDRTRQDEDCRAGRGGAHPASHPDRTEAEDEGASCTKAAHEHADRHRAERAR